MFGIKLIPSKEKEFTIKPDDGFIALAEDEA